jgi:phosphinothricin acetyltransferase
MTTTPTLRLASPDDAAAIAAIYAPMVRDTAITFELAEVSSADMAHRVTSTMRRHPWLVAEDDGDVLAYAYGTQHRTRAAYDWSVDVSVYVAQHARRRGLAQALYRALLNMLGAQGYANAFAGVALPNNASVGLHESLGFTHVGVYRAVGWKLGAWWDVGWWQLRLTSSDAPPRRLVPLPDLPRSEVVDALHAGAATLAGHR